MVFLRGEVELARPDEQAGHEDKHGNHYVEAHVALGADREDHAPIGVLEAADHSLLALAGPLNLLRHATPPSRPPGPWPSRSTRNPRRDPSLPSVARRAPPVPRLLSPGSNREGRSQPPQPSHHRVHLLRS